MAKRIPKDAFRIIKISKEALFEFICESMIDGQEDFMHVEDVGSIVSCFDINWENGDFIFLARNEREKGEDLQLPDEIDIELLMSKLPDTTTGMFNSKKKYVDMTIDDIIDLQTTDPNE